MRLWRAASSLRVLMGRGLDDLKSGWHLVDIEEDWVLVAVIEKLAHLL